MCIRYRIQDVEYITEQKDNGKKNYKIKGIFMQADIKNRNGRVYPMEVLEKEVRRYNKEQIKENSILIYMKGTPYEPKCGFSARTVQTLIECESQFSYVDVLDNNDVRVSLPKVSDWPTFPQVFINGELVGGADIIAQMHESGELKKLIDSIES